MASTIAVAVEQGFCLHKGVLVPDGAYLNYNSRVIRQGEGGTEYGGRASHSLTLGSRTATLLVLVYVHSINTVVTVAYSPSVCTLEANAQYRQLIHRQLIHNTRHS